MRNIAAIVNTGVGQTNQMRKLIMIDPKKERKLLKKFFRQKPIKPMVSLSETPRQRCKAYYEGLYEYGFLPEPLWKYSDEEIEEYLNEEMWINIYSPYDCTGKLFTQWITFHRNPCGAVSFVHSMGLDV